ncbi:MAG: SxtJ family membrane protein [candidate division NC10 bacterium]
MATGVPPRLSHRELRRFAVTVAIPLAILATLGVWRGHTILPALLGGLAAALGVLALLAPGILRPVQKVWMAGADALGSFNTRVLLGLVYFLAMTPIGVVMRRVVGRDPLDRRLRDRPSYWIERKRHPDPRSSMERRF